MIGKKLLVADDSLTIQKVIRLALSNEGYEIQTVSDGNDAIQQIAVFRPDIVLIDVSLPGKTAFEVKKSIEKEKDFAPVRFVLMSSAYEKVNENEIQESAFAGRLTKPFDPAHLRKILSDALNAPAALNQSGPELSPEEPESAWSPELPSSPDLPPMSEVSLTNVPSMTAEPLSNDLWGKDGEFIMPPPPPPIPAGLDQPIPMAVPPPPLPGIPGLEQTLRPAPSGNDHSDIKHLTESTIRMSGLDDFQWSVNEPSLKPPPGLSEPLDSNFKLDKKPETTLPANQEPPDFDFPPIAPPQFQEQGITIGQPSVAAPSSQQSMSQIAIDQLETVIQKQVEKAVEAALKKFAQATLPEVAERVIKEEIHRMLSGQI